MAATGQDGMDLSGASQEDVADRARRKRSQMEELTALMKNTIITTDDAAIRDDNNNENFSPVIDSVEGLAYLSTETALKESLSKDGKFLKRLFSLLPVTRKGNNLIAQPFDGAPVTKKTSAALIYGVTVIISNLVTFAPRLTKKESQLAKLRKLAKPGSAKPGVLLREATSTFSTVPDERENDTSVIERGKRLIKAGALPALAGLARTESVATRHAVGRVYLSLVEPKENRGPIMQNGGSKALMSLIGSSFSSLSSSPSSSSSAPSSTSNTPSSSQNLLAVDNLILIEALAKLTITTNPRLLFGTSDSPVIDAIRSFSLLLLHPQSTLLQRFEAMMALTNLASVSATLADRVATVDLATKLDVLILDDNIMVRRAATESCAT